MLPNYEHLYTVVFIEEVWGGALEWAQHREILSETQLLFSRFVINCTPLHCGFYTGGLGGALNLAQHGEICSETQLLFSRFVINCNPLHVVFIQKVCRGGGHLIKPSTAKFSL